MFIEGPLTLISMWLSHWAKMEKGERICETKFKTTRI